MLKKPFFSLFLFFLLLTILSFAIAPGKAIKTIVIDPGHGGPDQGADGLMSTEAQVTLAISKELGERLKKELPAVNVLFTRTTDIFPGNSRTKDEALHWRASFANQSRGDLFISIHCNSAGRSPGGWNERRVVGYNEKTVLVGKKKKKKKVVKVPVYETVYVPNATKGTETFVWTAAENSHKGQFVGENGEFDSGAGDSAILEHDNDPVINALKLVYTKKYFFKSVKLGEYVQQQFTDAGRINRGVKQRNEKGIWVLHATGMPSILIETGFISNKEEEEYMNSESGRSEIAGNILDAIRQYISSLDNPSKDNNNEGDKQVNGVAVLFTENRKNFRRFA